MTTAKKVYIETVGCQMNVLDSELVIGALKRQGYVLTDTAADADVVLFNTCSVREHAEEKVYSNLGRVAPHKRNNPDQVIGVIGCMAQKDQHKVRHRAPHVDLVVGSGQLARIPAQRWCSPEEIATYLRLLDSRERDDEQGGRGPGGGAGAPHELRGPHEHQKT